jgi:excisionase family DNA binding protein
MNSNQQNEVLTTQKAGNLLGLSATTIQKMVLSGEISAWTTPGGHRRIPLAEVKRLLASIQTPVASASFFGTPIVPQPRFRVLLAEDDPIQAKFFESLVKRCLFPVVLTVAEDAASALIQLERQRPDLLVTDLLMTPLDGFHLIACIEKDSSYSKLDVLILSALDRLEANEHGALPDWITFHQKPINPDRLLGFLDAMHSRMLRKMAFRTRI